MITILFCALSVVFGWVFFVAFRTSTSVLEVTYKPTKSVLVNASLSLWRDNSSSCKAAIIGSSQALNNINPIYAGLDPCAPCVFGAWGLPPSDALSIFQNHVGPIEHPIIPLGLPTGTMDSRIKMNAEHYAKENVAIPINSISEIQRIKKLEQNNFTYAKLAFEPSGHIPLCRISDGFGVSEARMTKSFEIDTTLLSEQVSLCKQLNPRSIFILLPWLEHDSSYPELNEWMDAQLTKSDFIDARNAQIEQQEWLDKCHLDSAGAIKLAQYIRPLLTQVLD